MGCDLNGNTFFTEAATATKGNDDGKCQKSKVNYNEVAKFTMVRTHHKPEKL
jgi:hypothetical protein